MQNGGFRLTMRLMNSVVVLSLLCLSVAAPTAVAEECQWFENNIPDDPPFEVNPECLPYPLNEAWAVVEKLLP